MKNNLTKQKIKRLKAAEYQKSLKENDRLREEIRKLTKENDRYRKAIIALKQVIYIIED